MTNSVRSSLTNLSEEENHSLDTLQPESTRKQQWTSPQLKEFGSLSFVVKGISYTPNDGISNLTT
jgi:hypothetical protein